MADDSTSDSTPPQQEPTSVSSATNVSGGANLNAGQVSITGDVVGRDKITSTGGGDEVLGNKVVNVYQWNIPKWVAIGFLLAMLTIAVVLILGPWLSSPATQPPAATITFTPTPTETPTKTPSPTPVPTPNAVVKAFTVMRGVDHNVVIPKETISVTAGESIRIKAEVLTNVNRDQLLFTWHTCRRGDEIVVWGNGVSEMTYEAPSAMASDCIRVRIEKGGALLDNSYIWVTVTE